MYSRLQGKIFILDVKYLLCVMDVFIKYVWIKLLTDKKAKTVIENYINLNESKCKPNKWWVDQGRVFYNIFIKRWLDDSDILIYSTYNEGKSVVVKRFLRTLRG